MSQQTPEMRGMIAALGQVLGPEVLGKVQALFLPEQSAFATAQPAAASDLPYGEHQRQRLDLYQPQAGPGEAKAKVPILLWVHGGGFLRGEKSSPDHPYNAHAGRWAARSGLLGAVMNYRLAPEAIWPAGGEDVAAAVSWLHANAADYGGDPERIVLIGTSAGAVHVATALRLQSEGRSALPGLSGAILLSGLYGFTPLDERDRLYYGGQELYAERMPRDAVVATKVPLFIACSEFDPARFQAEMVGLLGAILAGTGKLPACAIIGGHNHFSLAYHLGTADTRLASELLNFIRESCDRV